MVFAVSGQLYVTLCMQWHHVSCRPGVTPYPVLTCRIQEERQERRKLKGVMGLADEASPFDPVEESRPNLSLMQGVGE